MQHIVVLQKQTKVTRFRHQDRGTEWSPVFFEVLDPQNNLRVNIWGNQRMRQTILRFIKSTMRNNS